MTISTRLTSLLAICAVGLAGCSYAGADADREAAAQPAPTQPAAAQPAQGTTPTPTQSTPAAEPTASPAPSDGGGGTSLPSDGGGEVAQPSDGGGAPPIPAGVPLVDNSAGAVTYLRAIQNFSPTIESWQIKDGQLHYISHTCIGTVDFETYASLNFEDDGTSTARWEGNSPQDEQMGSASDEDRLMIDEATLRYVDTMDSDGPATVHYEAEFGEFTRMCGSAGKDLASFVL